MEVKISKKQRGIIGLCGHIGVGHTHSHSGFVQDDSAGLTVAASILKQALPINTTIEVAEADIKKSTIIIKTKDGGIGKVEVRRGITPAEAKMIGKTLGMDVIYNQEIVVNTFGRIYGQGAMEVAVSLQGAIALALVDTFYKKYPDKVLLAREDIARNYGKILGSVIDIGGIAVSILLTINASQGGIGPVEDLEGNVMLGQKGQVIKKLGLDKIPSIIIESKSFVPGKGDLLKKNTFLIRANQEYDNLTVAEGLIEATRKLNILYEYDFDALPRDVDDFTKASQTLGDRIIDLGQRFKRATTSREKVDIIADLSTLVSQDAAGVTFMSNELQRNVGSAGMLKGTSAVLSLLVTRDYIDHYKMPFVTKEDVKDYQLIIKNAIIKLKDKVDRAGIELEEKFDFNPNNYQYLYKE